MATKKKTRTTSTKKTTKTPGEVIGAAIGKKLENEIGKEYASYKKTSCKPCGPKKGDCNSGSCFYGLGIIGAAVYYLTTATGFWNGVWGFIKSLVWPAFLVHGLLKFLGL